MAIFDKSSISKKYNENTNNIKFATTIEVCNNKAVIDAVNKKRLAGSINQTKAIMERAEKEFEFAGFFVDKKCEANILKSIKEFDKTNKKYTPIDIVEYDKFYKLKLKFQLYNELLQDANIPTFYSIFYRIMYDYIVSEYLYLDMVLRLIDGRYFDIIVFSYKTRFESGKIVANYLAASPNPLDQNSQVVLHQINFNENWFIKSK